MTNLPTPEIPTWAAMAGVPEPLPGEGFEEYVRRLGYDFDELTADLMPHPAATAVLNLRLQTRLRQSLPEAFNRYVRNWIARVRAGYSYPDATKESA